MNAHTAIKTKTNNFQFLPANVLQTIVFCLTSLVIFLFAAFTSCLLLVKTCWAKTNTYPDLGASTVTDNMHGHIYV